MKTIVILWSWGRCYCVWTWRISESKRTLGTMSFTVAASWKRWASRTQTRTASRSGEIRDSSEVMHLGCQKKVLLSYDAKTMLINDYIDKQYVDVLYDLVRCNLINAIWTLYKSVFHHLYQIKSKTHTLPPWTKFSSGQYMYKSISSMRKMGNR